MYSMDGRVRYSEISKDGKMHLYSIVNYFQDCSNFQSTDIGIGVHELIKRHRAWLLSTWQIEIVNEPDLFDHLTIGTWPYDFKGMYGYRNFIMYNESKEHQVAAYANSIWFLVDTLTGKPIRIMPDDIAPYPVEPPYPMEYAARKVALPANPASSKEEAIQNDSEYYTTSLPPVPVTPMMLDTNNHVNNGQYIHLALNCLSNPDAVTGLHVEYRLAAVLGDVIHPTLYTGLKEEDFYLALNDAVGKPYAIVHFTTKKVH